MLIDDCVGANAAQLLKGITDSLVATQVRQDRGQDNFVTNAIPVCPFFAYFHNFSTKIMSQYDRSGINSAGDTQMLFALQYRFVGGHADTVGDDLDEDFSGCNGPQFEFLEPHIVCAELERMICASFPVHNAVICGVSTSDASLRLLMTVKKAAEYLTTLMQGAPMNIALSWGRTIQMLIAEFPDLSLPQHTVFPLFGATDQEKSYYLSNELARSFADQIGAQVKYAWFPYRPDQIEDCELFQRTSYYKKLYDLWGHIDLAVIGIGNNQILQTFGKAFGYQEKSMDAIGDLATHFFDQNGHFLELYNNTLYASLEDLKRAKQTVAIACGDDKAEAIAGALRTRVIDTLITDEYTARKILSL